MATTGNLQWTQLRSDNRQGNGSKGQSFGGGSPNAGEFVLYDANNNVISSGAKGTTKGDLIIYNGSAWVPLGVG